MVSVSFRVFRFDLAYETETEPKPNRNESVWISESNRTKTETIRSVLVQSEW